MKKIKKGDIVARISYGKDILFEVQNFIEIKQRKQAILKGITVRIEANAPIEDLEKVEKELVVRNLRSLESRLEDRIKKTVSKEPKRFNIFNKNIYGEDGIRVKTGVILHLDGDRKYSEKSARYYRSVGLNAVVKNIPENKQAIMVQSLLQKYNPDILVITRT